MSADEESLRRCEKIRTRVFPDSTDAAAAAARQIARLVRDKASRGEACVLGLVSGSTPTGVYAELVRMHRREHLSFENVVTFNLDEYYPMRPNELQSHRRYMDENLFEYVDIDPANVHMPDGAVALEDVAEYCAAYDRAVAEAGGIDLQLLGIGRTGHIGANEPGSAPDSRTRLIWLDRITRIDAAGDFFGEANVPRRAITMGVGTILSARRVILMAFGEGKAPIVARAVEGGLSRAVAASFLQEHPDAEILLDEAAAANLTRFQSPWVLAAVGWDEKTTRKAVIWLARRTEKAILKLTDEDYNEGHLQDLLAEHGPAYEINLRVFRGLQAGVTGWPGGKPPSAKLPGDVDRPRDSVFPKRVLVFSPHPDDDVISMGGTLIRLVQQGHDVHVAYQTSGNIAVFDDDAIRFADFARGFSLMFGIEQRRTEDIEQLMERSLRHKKPGQIDSPEVRKIKALIRFGEARAAARHCGASLENLHFLNMPFYETGSIRKDPLGEEDVRLVAELLAEIQPHQIYAAGDLSDPHGTHRTCLTAIFHAIERVKDQPWYAECDLWLYRGAWQEWDPEQIDMAVPLSPQELRRKRDAIFKHESQKDKALFPGSDRREFWQRAVQRNRATAALYDQLGLAEYEGIEAFVRWEG
ncbi:MAG: glucosamine-6-phosphate deaminase [Phycisphaerae bacterium]